ncbi:MAG TPA: hypothetical protein VNN80_26270, partial [Polyangiaceae bacterium]|nr:hypothetical protein [Polyangiaceae bacterium]
WRRQALRGAPTRLAPLLALAAAACSSEYPVGNLDTQSLPVGLVPDEPASGATGTADFQLEPLLSPPDVTMSGRPGITLTPAGLGDIDGDGYGDFAVTGFDESLLINYVHIRYGGPAAIEPEDQFALAESGARLAFEENSPGIESVGGAGDVNGDGFADVLVTATICEALLPGGGAYLLYGGPERLEGAMRIGDVATHLRLPSEGVPQTGCSTPTGAPLGLSDIDGDGLDDFMLVSYTVPEIAEPADPDAPTRSVGYLFYGREERLASGTTWLDADATIAVDRFFAPLPLGDVTADGRADFALGAELGSYFWVPGAEQRLSGEVDANATFATLGCPEGGCVIPPVDRAGDVDGDGVGDLIAYEAHNRAHLFYGGPGLLEGGVLDYQAAAASFIDELALPRERLFTPAGDRDGDGDADLLSLFYSDAQVLHTDIAFVSGTHARLAGAQTLPIQDAIASRPGGLPFPFVIEHQDATFEQDRVVFTASNAGDINGDGADDLLTTSMALLSSDETGTSFALPQVHIHYGTPGGRTPVPLR